MRLADIEVGAEYAATPVRSDWQQPWRRHRVRRVKVLDVGPFIAVALDEHAQVTLEDGVTVRANGFDRLDSGRAPRTSARAVAVRVLDQATGASRICTMVDVRDIRAPWSEYAAMHAEDLARDRERAERIAEQEEAGRLAWVTREQDNQVTAGLAARVGLRAGATVANHVYEAPGIEWPQVERRVLDDLLRHAAATGWQWPRPAQTPALPVPSDADGVGFQVETA